MPSLGHLGCYFDEAHGVGLGLWCHVDKKLATMTYFADYENVEKQTCGPPGVHLGPRCIHFYRNSSDTLQASSLAPEGVKCLQ
jgi:hypothetical protein